MKPSPEIRKTSVIEQTVKKMGPDLLISHPAIKKKILNSGVIRLKKSKKTYGETIEKK